MAVVAESTVGVNFVSNVQQALASISSLEGAVSRLGTAGKALGIIGAGVLIGAQIKGAISTVLSSGIRAENQLTMLTTSLQDAQKAFEIYQKTVQFASTTPFEVDQVIDSVVRLQAIGVEAYGIVKRTNVDVMTAIGNMAGAMGKSMDEASMAIIQGLTGEMERLKQFGIVVGNLPQKIQKLTRGSKEWRDELLNYIATLPRFQGGMARMSQTMTGIISNIKDGVTLFITSIADVREVTGFYAKVKAMLKGVADWIANNTQAIMLAGRIIGQVLGHIFDIIMILLSPLWAVVKMITNVFEAAQKKINDLAGQTATKIATFAEKTKAMGIVFERVKLYIALLFELVKLKLEAWAAAVKKVMDFFGIEASTVLKAFGILIGIWLVQHTFSLILTLGKLLFTLQNLQRVGIFLLVLAIAKLIEDWDKLSEAARAARIALIALGAILYLMATTQMVSWIKYLVMMRGAIIASLGHTIIGPALLALKGLAAGFMTGAAAAIKFAIALLMNPITWIVLAIIALIAAIVLLVIYWDEVSAAVKEAWASFSLFLDGLGSWGTQIKQGLEGIFGGFITYFQGLWDIIAGIFTLDWDRVKGGFDKVLTGINQFFTGVVNLAGGLIEGIFGALGLEYLGQKLNSALKKIWQGIKDIFGGLWDVIAGIFTGDWDRIFKGLTSIWEGIKNIFSGLWDVIDGVVNTIVDAFMGAVDGIKSAWAATKKFFGDVADGISNWWDKTTDQIADQWNQANSVVQAGMTSMGGFWEDTSSAIVSWWNDDTQTMGDLWNNISSSMQTRWNDFYTAFVATDFGAWFSGVVNSMKEMWNSFTTWLSGIWQSVWENITGFISNAIDSVTEWFGNLFGEDALKKARKNAERLGQQVATDLSNVNPTITLRANTRQLVSDTNSAVSGIQFNPTRTGQSFNFGMGGNSLFPMFGMPGYAEGGWLKYGQMGMVGERGPELIMGGTRGTAIFPNDVIRNLGSKNVNQIATNHINVNINVDARGKEEPKLIADETAAKLRETLPEVLRGLSFG